MSVPQEVQNQSEVKTDKDHNFAQLRKQVEAERAARLQAEAKAAELEKLAKKSNPPIQDDDDYDDEPYIDRKRLKKETSRLREEVTESSKNIVQQEVQRALAEERRNMWLKQNPDFYDIMQNANVLAEKDPELAETILAMPDNFERQKLVYKTIKTAKMHVKEEPKSDIQSKVDKNLRSPYYQPSGAASPPYASMGDFSASGQKNAYEKMKELRSRLRG